MKLQQLILENFQSHADSTIDFHANFNCIVGPTNVGKTAVFNALLFVFFNEWDSDFLRHDTQQCTVTALCDVVSIRRIKGKSVNSVELIYPDGSQKKFDNFGIEYPPEIKRLFTGFINDIPVCVAYQDSNSFLIHESPSAKGKILDYLSGISLLEETVGKITDKEKELKAQILNREYEKTNRSTELAEIAALGNLDNIQKEFNATAIKLAGLKTKIEKASFLKSHLDELSRQIGVLQTAAKVQIDRPEKILSFISQYTSAITLKTRLADLDVQIKKIHGLVDHNNDEKERLLVELTELLQQFQLCPFCGSKISASAVDHIFEELL